MRLKNLLAAGAALATSFGLAQAASAASQYHYFTFTNNTSETLSGTDSASGSGAYWSPNLQSTDVAGGNTSGTLITNDYATINFTNTWTSQVDNTYCTFSVYSQVNSYGNIQFYESTSKGGPRASSVTCTWTAPAQPYSTIHGNVTGTFKMSGF